MRRDLITTLTGIAAGQFVLFAATPFLARAYGPEAFGVYSVDVAVAGVMATAAALRFDLAVASASDDDVVPLARVALLLPWLVVPLLSFGLWLVLHWPGAERWSFGVADLPMIVAIALPQGLFLATMGLGTRLGRFDATATMRIVQPLVFVTLALTALRDLSLAMAIGWGAAMLAAIPVLRHVRGGGGWSSAYASARSAWRFPAISAPVALLDMLALALPLLFIAATFGEVSAGNYSQVQRLVGAPLSMMSLAVGQVFFKYAGDRFRAGQPLLPLVRKIAIAMAALAIAIAVATAAIGHPLLRMLIGPQWRTDTTFLLLALCPMLFRVVASPVSTTLIVTGRLATIARWQVGYFVVTLGTLYAAQRWLSFDGVLAAFACSEFLMYALYLLLSVRAAIGAARPRSNSRPVAA